MKADNKEDLQKYQALRSFMNKALFQKTDGQLSTAYDLDGGQIEVEKKSGCEQGQTSSYIETKVYPSRVLQVMAGSTD